MRVRSPLPPQSKKLIDMQNPNILRLLQDTKFKPLKIVAIPSGITRLFEYSLLKTNTGVYLKKEKITEGDKADCIKAVRKLEESNPLYLHVN